MLLIVSHVDLLLHQLAAASKAETLFGTRVGLHLRHELSLLVLLLHSRLLLCPFRLSASFSLVL